MDVIRNRYSVSILSKIVRHFLSLGLVIFFCYCTGIEYLLYPFFGNFWIITGVYILFSVVQIAYTNPSFYFKERSVLVKYPMLFRWKDFEVDFEEIQLALFRHEPFQSKFFHNRPGLTLLLRLVINLVVPFEYKWMKLETPTTKYLIFCFGLEYDYFDNNDEIRFETLKLAFSERGVKTLWTETDDVCFQND